jgi:radical SAM superfamily enzyme YgiQ (UPF0313 family)
MRYKKGEKMKVLLIAPTSGRWKAAATSKIFNGRTFRFSLLSLLCVAAETPPHIKVKIVDEQVEEIPWDERFDLVGITCMTALAPRAYEISNVFRRKNIPVVLGGMHPTLCPEDASLHADAIVIGDVEGTWEQILSDAQQHQLKKTYHSQFKELSNLKKVPRNLLNESSYSTINAVQATRGCPNSCEFCAVSAFHNKTQRQRPVEEVIEEVSSIRGRFFIFVDDNLTADKEYAARLFKALIPLNKYWATQSTISIADDPVFVALAAEAGCIGLFIGIGTFSAQNLNSVSKNCNRVEKYRAALRLFHSYGIAVEAGIVFGFDNDGPKVFQNTLKLLDEMEIDLIQASIFTPLPGTGKFEKMQHRIFDWNWANYDFHSVVFQPHKMSAESLQAGHDWLTREFYRPWRIIRRIWRHLRRSRSLAGLPYLAAVNLAYYGRVFNWQIRGFNPETKPEPPVKIPGINNAEQLALAETSLN